MLDPALAAKALLDRRLARASFHEFRKQIRPDKYKFTWLHDYLDAEFQSFYELYKRGKRPKLIVCMPPQHGKSDVVNDFICWVSGKDPSVRTIFAAFSERLGTRANKYLQRTIDSPKYASIFPRTSLSKSNVVTQSRYSARNSEFLEFVGQDGYFRNTTVQGSVTGEGLDLGVIDDPIKGRLAARSKAVREGTWDWFNDDFKTRFSDEAALLMVLTRWHLDDPAGRLIASDDKVKVISLPAIAEVDSQFRKAGEALFPEHKSLDFILGMKASSDPVSFASLYQQNPVADGGNVFKRDWLHFCDIAHMPKPDYRIVVGDTAQKAGANNDYSCFFEWGFNKALQKAWPISCLRGKFEYGDLVNAFKSYYASIKQGAPIRGVHIEDKSSGISLNQDLKRASGMPIIPIKRGRDSKEDRAANVIGHFISGNVLIPTDAPFAKDLVDELLIFPSGKNDDQVDVTVDAVDIFFNKDEKPKRRMPRSVKFIGG